MSDDFNMEGFFWQNHYSWYTMSFSWHKGFGWMRLSETFGFSYSWRCDSAVVDDSVITVEEIY